MTKERLRAEIRRILDECSLDEIRGAFKSLWETTADEPSEGPHRAFLEIPEDYSGPVKLSNPGAVVAEVTVEPNSPQAPIAKITVRESGAGRYAPDDVSVSLYAPGLPPGEHDVYCVPMSVAPALKSGDGQCTCWIVSSGPNCPVHDRQNSPREGLASAGSSAAVNPRESLAETPSPSGDSTVTKISCIYREGCRKFPACTIEARCCGRDASIPATR